MARSRKGGRVSMLCICIAFCVFLPRAHGATWHVTYDPAQPEDRVGAVAAQAASGDTILIDAGTYYEHIPLEGKSLTFIGLGGAGATILDGSRELAGREGSIIYTLTGERADLALAGLTLRNGTGAPDGYSGEIGGGAILWWERDFGFAGSLLVADCILEGNTTGGAENLWVAGGGAISAVALDHVSIERCSFSGNVCHEFGGDLFLASGVVAVEECHFELAEGGWSGGTSIHDIGGSSLIIRDCTFRAESGNRWSVGVLSFSFRIEVLDCRFEDHGLPHATRVSFDFAGVGDPRQDVLVSGCQFWSAAGPDSAAAASLGVAMSNAGYVIRDNTFVRCGVFLSTGTGSPLVFENNIVARGQLEFFVGPGGTLSCNDLWLTSVNDIWGNLALSNNITEDPLFCDESSGDLTLSEDSPCAPFSPPNESCDLIGALPVACGPALYACCVGDECQLVREEECNDLGGIWLIDPPRTSCDPNPCLTPAVKTTWGGIKAMFRDR